MTLAYDRAEMQARILERVGQGWSVQRLAGEAGFPSRARVQDWAREDAGFREALAAARARGGIKTRRYPKAELQTRVIDRVERGWSLARLGREPGFPSITTVERWAAADEAFRRRLDGALEWRRMRSRPDPWAGSFDAVRAQAHLARVRRGDGVGRIMRERGAVGWKRLRRWKAERPDFAADYAAAVRLGRALGRTRWRRFDEALGDRIILRVGAGEPLKAVAGRGDGAPCLQTIARWRRQSGEFDGGVALAISVGRARRGRGRRTLTPALTERVLEAICRGASMSDLAKRPDMPCSATLYGWLRSDAEFAGAVSWACEMRQFELLNQATEVAMAATPETVAAARLKVAAIHRRIERLGRRRAEDEG